MIKLTVVSGLPKWVETGVPPDGCADMLSPWGFYADEGNGAGGWTILDHSSESSFNGTWINSTAIKLAHTEVVFPLNAVEGVFSKISAVTPEGTIEGWAIVNHQNEIELWVTPETLSHQGPYDSPELVGTAPLGSHLRILFGALAGLGSVTGGFCLNNGQIIWPMSAAWTGDDNTVWELSTNIAGGFFSAGELTEPYVPPDEVLSLTTLELVNLSAVGEYPASLQCSGFDQNNDPFDITDHTWDIYTEADGYLDNISTVGSHTYATLHQNDPGLSIIWIYTGDGGRGSLYSNDLYVTKT